MVDKLAIQTVMVTDAGLVRERNEDRLHVSDQLFVIADGMGGHSLGDAAAEFVVDALASTTDELETADFETRKSTITEALTEAARAIERHVDSVYNSEGSKQILDFGHAAGSTVVGLHLGEKPLVFHVGDSRLYRYRDGILTRLTRDHSLVQEMVDMCEIFEQDAHNHPHRNIITRAIGTYGPPDVEFSEVELRAGDLVMLCSDGLSDELLDERMEGIFRTTHGVEQVAKELLSAALDEGGKDNISIVLIEIQN